MMAHSTQGDMPGGQQWIPSGPQWTQNGVNPAYGAQTPNHNPNPHRHAHPQNPMHNHPPLDTKNMQQQIPNLQQQMQHLMSNSASSGSVIGSTSLANSAKNSILFALSSFSTPNSYQNSWILDSGATNHLTPLIDQFLPYELCIT